MNKVFKDKHFIISTLLCFVPMVWGLLLYSKLPEQIPSHFGNDGGIDDYMPKAVMVFGMPLFFAAMNSFMVFMMDNDPKKRNYSKTIKKFFMYFMPFMSILMVSMSLLISIGYDIPVSKVVNVFVGVLFIVCGNYLPKSRQNYTVGIKIPWTLNSEENWNKTHRLAGKLWMVGGVIMVTGGLFNLGILSLTLVLMIPLLFIPYVYSYMLYKKGV